jgi:formate dehydrogenase subunit gamma
MDFFRTARNPWGEEIYLGLSWTTFWIVVGLGAFFVVLHALMARRGAKAHAAAPATAAAAGIPAKVSRHGRSARISHWILAASVLTLLVTSFVPIFGLKFQWLTLHWVSGVILAAYVVYHTVDTIARGSWGRMLGLYRGEIGQSLSTLMGFLKGSGSEVRTGKWNIENKLFHHLTALTGFLAIGTGLLMMTRIDTWFWTANPYGIFTDKEWGVVFVLHGVSAVLFVGLLIAHIYFALRPDKFFFTKSMIFGWIKREDYLAHYDPQRWRVGAPVAGKSAEVEETVPAGSGSAERR